METTAAEQRAIAGKTTVNASLSTVLSDRTMWQLIALNFFYQTGIYGYTLWLPTILKELTHTSMGEVRMLAILPYVGRLPGCSCSLPCLTAPANANCSSPCR